MGKVKGHGSQSAPIFMMTPTTTASRINPHDDKDELNF